MNPEQPRENQEPEEEGLSPESSGEAMSEEEIEKRLGETQEFELLPSPHQEILERGRKLVKEKREELMGEIKEKFQKKLIRCKEEIKNLRIKLVDTEDDEEGRKIREEIDTIKHEEKNLREDLEDEMARVDKELEEIMDASRKELRGYFKEQRENEQT